jgi:hypothetical protein
MWYQYFVIDNKGISDSLPGVGVAQAAHRGRVLACGHALSIIGIGPACQLARAGAGGRSALKALRSLAYRWSGGLAAWASGHSCVGECEQTEESKLSNNCRIKDKEHLSQGEIKQRYFILLCSLVLSIARLDNALSRTQFQQ